MPETFTCPACCAQFPYWPDLVGLRVSCPTCAYPFSVNAPRRRLRAIPELHLAFSECLHQLNDLDERLPDLLPADPLDALDDPPAIPLMKDSVEAAPSIPRSVQPPIPLSTDPAPVPAIAEPPPPANRDLISSRRLHTPPPLPQPGRVWTTHEFILFSVGMAFSFLGVLLLFVHASENHGLLPICFIILIAGLSICGYVILRPHVRLLLGLQRG